jgi:hypothetical protein
MYFTIQESEQIKLKIQHHCCRKQWGKQSRQDPSAGSRNYLMLADSGDVSSQSPESQSVSGDG